MANHAAAIVAICVFIFYILLLTAMGIYWYWSRRQHHKALAEMEAQAAQYDKDTVFVRTIDGELRPTSRAASMFSDSRSVRSLFYEGPGRQSSGHSARSARSMHSRNSSSSSNLSVGSGDRRYTSAQSNLIPLRQVSDSRAKVQEGTQVDEIISVYSDRSRASSVSTLRYYAEARAEDEIPALPSAVLAPVR